MWANNGNAASSLVSALPLAVQTGSAQERRQLWGASLSVPRDVFEVFANFVEGKLPRLPWCETSVQVLLHCAGTGVNSLMPVRPPVSCLLPLQLETERLKDVLVKLNKRGFLTINSQVRPLGR